MDFAVFLITTSIFSVLLLVIKREAETTKKTKVELGTELILSALLTFWIGSMFVIFKWFIRKIQVLPNKN